MSSNIRLALKIIRCGLSGHAFIWQHLEKITDNGIIIFPFMAFKLLASMTIFTFQILKLGNNNLFRCTVVTRSVHSV